AYPHDFVPGENNMNEEWWGIVAKGPTDGRGLITLHPRAAYYALQRIHAIDPYAPGTTLAAMRRQFAQIDPAGLTAQARAERAGSGAESSALRLKGMRLELSTYLTGGQSIRTPPSDTPSETDRPAFTGFDRMESFYVEMEAKPSERLQAALAVNILGHVPENPIDEIFYENRGRVRTIALGSGETLASDGLERLKVYRAHVTWDAPQFRLEAFHRSGHYHWGYEGDFFGVYREANYGRNIDIYNAVAPMGMEVTGKRRLEGLKVAIGPELWWGANPAALFKYRRRIAGIDITGLYHEDLARIPVGSTTSSLAIPLPPTRRVSLHLATTVAGVGVDLGGIWAGSTRVGETFQWVEGGAGRMEVLADKIRASDTFGAKAKVSFSRGRVNWYAQGAVMGLVADGGPTAVQTFTGWWLRDTGMSNQWNAMTGMTYSIGALQIAPNVLIQQPLVGPIPQGAPAPARLRNVLRDPFVVRANREMAAGELLLTWDPTPATWMYQWDNDVREDARFAASLAYTYKHQPTGMDAAIGILGDGRTPFAFPASTPARDLWEVRARVVTRVGPTLRLIANAYGGTAEPNGNSQRLVSRVGGDLRLVSGPLKVIGSARFNDFGPYDYHRDFNLTFPAQFMTDVAYVFGKPQWFDLPETKLGLRGTWRSLDRYSPRYCPTTTTTAAGDTVCDGGAPGFPLGREWEIRSYLTVAW
ncbi:MAG: glycosidase, partial [Gemmatimonadaceae bacterium]